MKKQMNILYFMCLLNLSRKHQRRIKHEKKRKKKRKEKKRKKEYTNT